MLKPDKFFEDFLWSEFEQKNRRKAKSRFRRAVREYYALQRRYVIEPETGERVQSFRYGQAIVQQKNQRRKVDLIFRGRNVGQPKKLEIKILMSRLSVMWGLYAKTNPTFSWKKSPIPTGFELMLLELLPKLGAKHVRRYAENHWQEREKKSHLVK
jgi:hypothetical protein